jgi:hypothetical protein
VDFFQPPPSPQSLSPALSEGEGGIQEGIYKALTVSAFGGFSINYRKILRGSNLTKFLSG